MRARTYAPPRRRLFSKSAWVALVFVTAFFAALPLLNVFVALDHPLHVSSYAVALLGKFMCYAIAALALDLVWGYTGILSLGHGLLFALGGYAHGMYLMRAIGREGAYRMDLPDFMVFLDWKAYPWYWSFTDHFWFAMLLVVVVPGLLAFVFGYFAFRSRIKGVYFSIITQALTFAAMLLFFRNNTGFGGNNGFTDFKRILGFPITAPGTRAALYLLTLIVLVASLIVARALVRSKLGRVLTAVRDAESRLMFVGYDQLWFKLFVWTLSAVLCGIAGALYVPQVGIINPSEMSPANSIEMVIWVATGGRGTLIGPIIGAGVVNGLKTWLTTAFPEVWLYALGLVFVLVTLFLPQGIVGLFRKLVRTNKVAVASAPTRETPATPATPVAVAVIPPTAARVPASQPHHERVCTPTDGAPLPSRT
ncbi:MAG: urea ABC transporter permease subunit UrtC [Burkholderiaceae bacterium]